MAFLQQRMLPTAFEPSSNATHTKGQKELSNEGPAMNASYRSSQRRGKFTRIAPYGSQQKARVYDTKRNKKVAPSLPLLSHQGSRHPPTQGRCLPTPLRIDNRCSPLGHSAVAPLSPAGVILALTTTNSSRYTHIGLTDLAD